MFAFVRTNLKKKNQAKLHLHCSILYYGKRLQQLLSPIPFFGIKLNCCCVCTNAKEFPVFFISKHETMLMFNSLMSEQQWSCYILRTIYIENSTPVQSSGSGLNLLCLSRFCILYLYNGTQMYAVVCKLPLPALHNRLENILGLALAYESSESFDLLPILIVVLNL